MRTPVPCREARSAPKAAMNLTRTRFFTPFCAHALRALLLVLVAIAYAGCTPSRHVERMEANVQDVLRRTQKQLRPGQPVEEIRTGRYNRAVPGEYEETVTMDLQNALELAARHSRDYQTLKEQLYRDALTLWVTAHGYEWNVTNSLSGVLSRDIRADSTLLAADADAGLTRDLAAGGRIGVSLAVGALRILTGDTDTSLDSLVSLTLRQPLLSGSGRLVGREPLTQAERNLVYSLRRFVRQRKQLVIRVSESYYNVLSANDAVAVAQRNYENLRASRERSEDMAEAGRVPRFQVDQARQNELTARSTLITRKQNFQAQKDALKQVLGLPLTVSIAVDEKELTRLAEAPLPQPEQEIDAAIAEALANRLDFATTVDRLGDACGAVAIAWDDLRARLDLTLTATADRPPSPRLRFVEFDEGFYSAGLDGDLPIDKTAETADYRRAQINRDQQQREVDRQRDAIIASIRDDWRNLEAARENFAIQKLSVELAQSRVDSTEMLFQAGRVNMRDVLEARDSLTNAENALTRALITHRLAWLTLLFHLERLPAEPETLWSPALTVSQAARGNVSSPGELP